MRTIIIFHEVDDVDRWLESPRRREVFGPLGITARTFVDPEQSNRVGLIVEAPSMELFEEAMASPGRGRGDEVRRRARRHDRQVLTEG